jgi:hypothetical protein
MKIYLPSAKEEFQELVSVVRQRNDEEPSGKIPTNNLFFLINLK